MKHHGIVDYIPTGKENKISRQSLTCVTFILLPKNPHKWGLLFIKRYATMICTKSKEIWAKSS